MNQKLVAENKELVSDIKKRKKTNLYISAMLLMIVGFLTLQLINKHNYKTLNTELESKKEDLETSNHNLAIANKELERFVFVASHDLKTPLHNIMNFTELLETQLKDSKDGTTQEYLAFVKKGGERLNKIISNSLEYSEHSNNKFSLIEEEVDLNLVLEEVTQQNQYLIDEINAEIIKSKRLPTIKGHFASWVIMFQKIIENGIKYNESNRPTIKIDYVENIETFSILFTDNGIGIKKEQQQSIFQMFSRLHTHSDYAGTGLGLAICKKIIEQQKGEVLLKSEFGKGSTFEFKLPLNKKISNDTDFKRATSSSS